MLPTSGLLCEQTSGCWGNKRSGLLRLQPFCANLKCTKLRRRNEERDSRDLQHMWTDVSAFRLTISITNSHSTRKSRDFRGENGTGLPQYAGSLY